MKVAILLLAILNLSVALPAQNFSWSEIKGANLIVKPVSNDYIVDKPNNARIIGGDEVTPHSRPNIVALLVNGQDFCTGSLISPNYVLTAVHCTASASYVELIFGAHNINIQETTQLRVTSSSMINHAEYKIPYEHSNDIALIKTPSPVVTNSYIQTARLPPANAGRYESFTPALSGWGSTSESSTSISPTLREVYVVVLNNAGCEEIFGSTYGGIANLCTSGRGPAGGCNGDSGAPLMVGSYQIGILSFIASEGCEQHEPTGFTRVSYYRDWIEDNSGV
ncbi:hypothetical protein NQ315_011578 [Exocentrus adspersus]|uniref:Peptidase S1 domain-containing protein n=1 Tax=Exocentrus adspersus TaxID=1586481 RepID=A0AAV8VUQ5_9CUCU|nr:hypothetical protein NQ315_011578 [Exocentrus adspersus]